MTKGKTILSIVAAAVCCAVLLGIIASLKKSPAATETPAPVSIFNGENLDGWVAFTDPEDTTGTGESVFTVSDGMINISGNPFGYLRTEKTYGDYKAHIEFRWVGEEGTNSGFFQRIQDGDKLWPAAVECQLCHGKLGQFVALGGARLDGKVSEEKFPTKERPSEVDPELPVGEWNSIDVEVKGNHIAYYVNGSLQNEVDCDFTSGHIALQSEGGPLQVRNITVQEL